MLRCVGLTMAMILASACGRSGFQPGDGDLEFAAGGIDPFGGAQAFSINLAETGATLAPEDGFTTRGGTLVAPIMTAGAAAFGDRLYLAGGASNFGGADCSDAIYEYDPEEDSVTQVATARYGFRGGSAVAPGDGFLYYLNGYCSSGEDEVNRLVPGQTAPELVGYMPEETFFQTAGHVPGPDGNRVLLAVGGFGSGPLKDVVQWMNPANGETARSSLTLPTPRCLQAGATVGDVFYAIGGRDDDGANGPDCAPPATTANPQLMDDVIAVEASPERVEVIAHLPEPVAAACAVPDGAGNILLMGGLKYETNDATTYQLVATDEILEIAPSGGAVTDTGMRLPEPRYGMACVRTESGRILVAGGSGADDVALDDILLFQPFTDSGTLLGPVLDAGGRVAWTHANWIVDVPDGAALTFELRVSSGPGFADDDTGWEVIEEGGLPSSLPLGRYAQWRATLTSTNGWASPVISSLSLSYTGE